MKLWFLTESWLNEGGEDYTGSKLVAYGTYLASNTWLRNDTFPLYDISSKLLSMNIGYNTYLIFN